MINFDYAASQMAAVWNMAWNRPGWQDALDRSVDGVFKSFWAAAFAAPFPLLGYFSLRRAALNIPELRDTPLFQAPPAFGLTVEIIGYLVNWGAGLAALILLARALGAGARIADVIIGFNWLHVLTAIAQAIPQAVLGFAGQREIAGILSIPSAVLVIALIWGYIRRSLGASLARSLGILLFLILLSVFTALLIEGLASLIVHAFS